jgi:hypothetical protein
MKHKVEYNLPNNIVIYHIFVMYIPNIHNMMGIILTLVSKVLLE